MHRVHHRLEKDALILDLRADHDEEAGDDQPVIYAATCRPPWPPAPAPGPARQPCVRRERSRACGQSCRAAAVRRPGVSRQQVQQAQAGLHPHHAAHQRSGGDPRLGKKFDIAAGAQKRCGQQQRRGQVRQRTGQRQGKLPAALAGALLAFRVGVGKQSADGQQQNGAQPQSQPCGHQQPRRLAHHHCSHQHKEQPQAAPNAVRAAQRQANGLPEAGKRHGRASRRPSSGPAELTSHAYKMIVECRTPACFRYAGCRCASLPDRSVPARFRPRRGLPPGPPATGCAKLSSTCWRRASDKYGGRGFSGFVCRLGRGGH